MIRLNVFIQTQAATHDEVLAAAKELTAASLAQDGCVAYDVFTSATRPNVLLICETWRDAAALSAHEASEPFVRLVAKMQELAAMKLEKFPF